MTWPRCAGRLLPGGYVPALRPCLGLGSAPRSPPTAHPLTPSRTLCTPAPQIKALMEELQKEAMTLGQSVYGSQGGAAPGGEGGDAGAGGAGAGSSGPKGDDVIDAEFTESDKKP